MKNSFEGGDGEVDGDLPLVRVDGKKYVTSTKILLYGPVSNDDKRFTLVPEEGETSVK